VTDPVVTAICTECNYVYTWPQVFEHNCPDCGTAKPPIDIDLLAKRHQERKEGKKLEPIPSAPPKGSELMEQFKAGVRKLRRMIIEQETRAELIHNQIDNADASGEDAEVIARLRTHAAAARSIAGDLRSAEREISAIFILSDDAESYVLPRNSATGRPIPGDKCPVCKAGLLERVGLSGPMNCDQCGFTPFATNHLTKQGVRIARKAGERCPRKYDNHPNKWCPGNLRERHHRPRQLECDECGMCWDKDPNMYSIPQQVNVGDSTSAPEPEPDDLLPLDEFLDKARKFGDKR
jgi:hypothetical protein